MHCDAFTCKESGITFHTLSKNHSMMKKSGLSVLIFLFLVVAGLYSGCKPKEKQLKISVKLEITGKGFFQYGQDTKVRDDYFSRVCITNQEDTTITFWMMSCSWWHQTLIFDTDSMEFSTGGCDKNITVEIKLKPGKSIVFYPVFHDNSIYRLSHGYYVDSKKVEHPAFPVQSKDNRQVRIGFILLKNEAKTPYMDPDNFVKSGQTYWSNPVPLNRYRNNSYRVEE